MICVYWFLFFTKFARILRDCRWFSPTFSHVILSLSGLRMISVYCFLFFLLSSQNLPQFHPVILTLWTNIPSNLWTNAFEGLCWTWSIQFRQPSHFLLYLCYLHLLSDVVVSLSDIIYVHIHLNICISMKFISWI